MNCNPRRPPPFTGYLVKPLRAASLAARLTMAPEIAAPNLAGDELIETPDAAETPAVAPRAGFRSWSRKTTRSTRC